MMPSTSKKKKNNASQGIESKLKKHMRGLMNVVVKYTDRYLKKKKKFSPTYFNLLQITFLIFVIIKEINS